MVIRTVTVDTPMVTTTTIIGHALAGLIDDPIVEAGPAVVHIAPVSAAGAMAAAITPVACGTNAAVRGNRDTSILTNFRTGFQIIDLGAFLTPA